MLDKAQIEEKLALFRESWKRDNSGPLDKLIQNLVNEGADDQTIRQALTIPFWQAIEKGGYRFGINYFDLPGVPELAVAYKKEKQRTVSFFNSQIARIPDNLSHNVKERFIEEIYKARDKCLKAVLTVWLMPLFKSSASEWADPKLTEELILDYYLSDDKTLEQIESYLLKREAKEGQKGLFNECIFKLVEELRRIGKSQTASYPIIKEIISLAFDCELHPDSIRQQYKREKKANPSRPKTIY